MPPGDDSGPSIAPDEAPPPDASAEAPEVPQKSKAAELDDLFATLKTVKDKEKGKEAELAILRLWLESGSDTVDLLMGWSLKAMEQKNYALALDFLDRIVAMKPDYAEGWNKRATVHFLMEDYSKSIADIGRTLELEPRHFGALSGLGMILANIGDDKRAIEAYKRALDVDPYLDNVDNALENLEAKVSGKDI
jgi:tetratricopeptide (TPR) repeat protein